MNESDPHIHVESNLNAGVATREVLASTFGLAHDLPPVVTTGCGLRVPRAMTSTQPPRVTCLACREHASRQYLSHAEQVESLGGTPGLTVSSEQVRLAATEYRDLARQFSDVDP
ncbi:MAG: hypothetical protein ABW215_20625 [Kibdelosporangium sp.]